MRDDIEAVRAELTYYKARVQEMAGENALLKRRVAALRRNIDDRNVELVENRAAFRRRINELETENRAAKILLERVFPHLLEFERADREAADIVATLMDEIKVLSGRVGTLELFSFTR